MRSAALIFGLLAGVLGGAVIVFGNLDSGLASALNMGPQGEDIAKFAVYLIPNLGLLGAGLALVRPRLGGLLMLLSAAAWAAAALVAGHGAVLFAAIPFTFVGAGGLVALFARPRFEPRDVEAALDDPEPPADFRRGRELVPHRPLVPPPEAYDDDGEADEVFLPEPPPYAPARQQRGRSEPDFGLLPRQRTEPAAPPLAEEPPELKAVEPEEEFTDATEEEEDYPPEDDYIDADPAPPENNDDIGEARPDRPAARNDERESDRPLPPERARQDRWSLPDPREQPPRARVPRPRYLSERQPSPPVRREPLPEPDARRRRPTEQRFDPLEEEEEEFAPASRQLQRRGDIPYGDYEPYDPDPAPRDRRNPLRLFLRLLILLLFLLVVGGIALAVYLDYSRGPRSLLFGARVAKTAQVVSPSAPHGLVPSLAPAGPSLEEAAAPPASTPDAMTTPGLDLSPAPVPLAPPPAAIASSGSDGMNDPFAYCRSVNTIDAPDSSYGGPAAPPAILAALNASGGPVAPDQLRWRCDSQVVLACNAAHSAACDLTPTVDLMVSYCAQHPDTKSIPAPNGSWSCNGTRPVIPRDQKWPVDHRGFFPGAWMRVAPPAG